MADPRHFELEDLVNRPGTYFNPQTEVLVIVDDSPDLDTEIFNMEDFEGADWVLISDESAIERVVEEVLQSNPDEVHRYLDGKDKLFGFFVGEVMKKTRGKANPKMLNDLLRRRLAASRISNNNQ